MLVEAFVPGVHDSPLSLLYGRARAVDPALSDTIHSSTGRKPWTATQLPDGMRLAFLEDAPREAVLRGLAAAGHRIEILSTDTYAGIVQAAQPVEHVHVEFVTPTGAGHRHLDARRADRQRERFDLLPYPRRVFGSLVGRWLGPALPEIAWERIWVEHITVRTVRTHLPALGHNPQRNGPPFVGIVGTCVYEFSTLDDQARCALWALARFARYTGVGSRTGYGMGCVRMEVRDDRRLAAGDAGPQPATVPSQTD